MCEVVDGINMAQEKIHQWACVNMVVNHDVFTMHCV
jgi:hypothetical protein